MAGTRFQLEVNPKLPERLARLDEVANNLWYSWDRPTRTLFARLHPSLWGAALAPASSSQARYFICRSTGPLGSCSGPWAHG